MALFGVIVFLILVTIADRVAVAVAENDIADQFVSNGLKVKPSVTIEGFPFLTQVWPERDLRQIDISASEVPVPAGPVTIDITSIKATVTGLHLKSFSGGTADKVAGTMFVSFADLTPALDALPGASVTLAADGPNLVTLNASLGPLSASAEAKVTYTATTVTVQLVNNGSLLNEILNSVGPFSFSLPQGVPAGLRITNVSVTAQGVSASVGGSNVDLSEPAK